MAVFAHPFLYPDILEGSGMLTVLIAEWRREEGKHAVKLRMCVKTHSAILIYFLKGQEGESTPHPPTPFQNNGAKAPKERDPPNLIHQTAGSHQTKSLSTLLCLSAKEHSKNSSTITWFFVSWL